MLNKHSVTSGSPSIKCNAGKGHCPETLPASLCCAKLAKPQCQLGTHLRGKYVERQDSKTPSLPRELSRSRVPNAQALPQPQLEQRETPFYFVGAMHKSTVIFFWPDTGNSTTKKPRFRQTKPVPHLVDLPLQGPADRLPCGSLSFCSFGCKRKKPVSATANAVLELVSSLPLYLCCEHTSFHHVWNASAKETPSCACGTSIHPRAWLHHRGVRMQQGTED